MERFLKSCRYACPEFSDSSYRRKEGVGILLSDKVAIIGVHGIFPYAESLADFDRVYSEKKDCMHEMPAKRKKLNGFDENKNYIQSGYLTDIDFFDYAFFGISKHEAACMDPQHRLSIETACKAIESAGYSLSSMRGTNTAVIVGASDNYYRGLFDDDTGFSTTGAMIDTLAGRISYLLDLHGEASVMGTSCSSSMYAAYDAYLKLVTNQCDMALAGGAYISYRAYEKDAIMNDSSTLGLASADGRCKAFEDSADGINTCESVGFVLMKRYGEAVRDKDNILAVIDAAGSNQDGARSNSFSAPSVAAQAELFEKVWRKFSIDPERIGYIEAHGTGTKIGDPIEIASITSAYRKFTDKKQICPVGSLKTNYAHPGMSAGIASIIKAIVSFRYSKKYPLRTLDCPNKMIDFQNSPVYPIRETEEWNDEKKIMAINSFGVSGTNVHMVLENYTPDNADDKAEPDEFIVTVSAKNAQQISEYKKAIKESIRKEYKLSEICYVLNAGRDDYEYRDSAAVRSFEELDSFLSSERQYNAGQKPKLVFLCSGSRKYTGSDIEVLRKRYPVFRDVFDRLSAGCGSSDALSASADAAIISQLEAWGIKPDVILGTKLGNAAVSLCKNGVPAEGTEALCEKSAASDFAGDKFLAYIKNLYDAEGGKLICADISGGGILLDAISDVPELEGVHRIPLLRELSLLESLSELYNSGFDIDWSGFYKDTSVRKVMLAAYPFLRTSAWPAVIKNQAASESAEDLENEENLRDFLRRIWMESLEADELDDDDDLFDLGANSLISMSILKKIEKRTGVEMDFEDLYDYCTVNELYDYLSENAQVQAKKSVQAVPRSEKMKVSGNQKRMLYIQDEALNKAVYNMPILYRIEGRLNEEVFIESLKSIIKRHEIMHTVYSEEEGEYYQHILSDYDCEADVIDGTQLSVGEIYSIIEQESQRAFDLSRDIPVRIMLIRKSDELYYWFLNIHHIAADGWSLGLFYNDMETLYNRKLSDRNFELEPIKIQYADYAYHEYEYLNSAEAEKEISYWEKELDKVRGILDFPIDKKRPEIKRYFGTAYRFTLDNSIYGKIESFAKKHNMSVFMLLESVYAMLLFRYSGETDICVGIPIANRSCEEFEKIIGFFANTVVIRSCFEENDTIESFLGRNKEKIAGAFANSQVSFEEIVKRLTFERRQSHSVLYQYSFTFQNYAYRDMRLEGVSVIPEFQQNPSVKFDLNFIVRKISDSLFIEAEYDTDLFTAGYIEEICRNYVKLLETVLENDSAEIVSIGMETSDAGLASDDISDSLF